MNSPATRVLLMPTRFRLCLSLSIIAQLMSAAVLVGQGDRERDRILLNRGLLPVGLALADSLPIPTAVAVILRRPYEIPHDVIIMDRAEDDEELMADALFTLQFVHTQVGHCPERGVLVRVDPEGRKPQEWSRGGPEMARRMLEMLEGAEAHVVGRFGELPYQQMWIRRVWGSGAGLPDREALLRVCPHDALPSPE